MASCKDAHSNTSNNEESIPRHIVESDGAASLILQIAMMGHISKTMAQKA